MGDLFDTMVEESDDPFGPPPIAVAAMALRDYQANCVASVLHELKTKSSTLYVMATGTGKTVTFAHIADGFPGRVLVLAHRQELIYQAQRTFKAVLGVDAEIEMGDQWADRGARVVISTVQTQGGSRGGRKNRFNPNDFSLVIVDEAHHAAAESYKSILQHYQQNKALKVCGCTATPDRADEEALGQIFDSVAFEYELPDAIRDGWLVMPHTRQVFVDSLDFSRVRTTAGDLNGADLAAVMEEEANLHKMADPIYQLSGGRQTLIFAVSVAQSERLCEILNRHRPDCARHIDGKTPDDIRAKMLRDYQEKRFQFLSNCAVATEGFDCPNIEVVIPKPTKSRALFAQMVGRGTRTLPGTVDGIPTADRRRAAIAASGKPWAEVIDFCGVTGRHELVSTLDILGGNYSPAVQARAKENIATEPGQTDPEAQLRKAKQQLEDEEAKRAEIAKRAVIIGKASFVSSVNTPFATLGISIQSRGWDKPATAAQHELLKRNKFDAENLTQPAAGAMIGEIMRRRKLNLATVRQAAILKRNGFSADMSFARAKKTIDILAGNKWRWPVGVEVPSE